MRKSFDDLTIADDFMFCSVMQDPQLCKKLLTLVLADTIGTILLVDLKGSSSDASPFGKKLKDKSPNVPTLCITGTANGFI